MKSLLLVVLILSVLFANCAFGEQRREYLEYDKERVRLDIYNPGYRDCPVVILIHGAAGIEGIRAARYKGFATDLMNNGAIAINVYYLDSRRKNWTQTIIQTIDYAQEIPNADRNRIGILGYSLGGTVALKVASSDRRVKLLATNAGYLPSGFTKEDAANLPKTLMISGTKDHAINTLNKIKQWFKELGKPLQTQINRGLGHNNIPMSVFNKNWKTIVRFFRDNL